MRTTPFRSFFLAISLSVGVAAPLTVMGQPINTKQIVRQVVPRDAIPALTSPEKIAPQDATFLRDDDRVIALHIAGAEIAYPARILDHHEIVNDVVNGRPIVVTY